MDGLKELSEKLHLSLVVLYRVSKMLMIFVKNTLDVDFKWPVIMMVFILLE